jgi:hypothetical protein
MLFATDNFGFAVLNTIHRCLPHRNICKVQSYQVAKHTFCACSVAREFREQLQNFRFTVYFCKRDAFVKYKKISSNLTKWTLGLIGTEGHEYITHEHVKPFMAVTYTLDDLFDYSIHNAGNATLRVGLIILRDYLTKVLQQAYHERAQALGNTAERHLHMERAARQWLETDPNAALSAIGQSDLPAEVKRELGGE